jgi:DNA-binding NtrC family response regulator
MTPKAPQNVLIVSDDQQVTRLLLAAMARRATRGVVATAAQAAAQQLAAREWRLVVVDQQTAGDCCTELVARSVAEAPEVPVVLVAAEGCGIATAVAAMRRGCRDVLQRPLSADALEALLDELLPNHDVPLAAADEEEARCLYTIAGCSESFMKALRLARKVAQTSVSVLITGESGTGKELVSYFVHRQSQRRHGPYIRVNCAAVSETLLESELFGHERGAFTGAHAQRKGRFERAHGGTLLLDEISETQPRLQAELLRVLEQQDFERVGGSEPVRVNVRVISTSNRDLAAEMECGRFRRDLYFRLGGMHLHLPPLRERLDDLPALTWHFVNLYAREARRRIETLDQRMLEVFRSYHWPGNIRQLRNVVRTALVLGEGPALSLDAAPQLQEQLAQRPQVRGGRFDYTSLSLQDLERKAIFEALRRTSSHQAKAARLLGITDRTLREKLRRYRQENQAQQTGDRQWLMEPA